MPHNSSCSDRYWYLASPYTDPDPEVRRERFEAVSRFAGRLMQAGVFVFSSISHSHPITQCGELPGEWDFWTRYDRCMLAKSSGLIVCQLEGWDVSIGVQAEIAIAKELRNDIRYVCPQNVDDTRWFIEGIVVADRDARQREAWLRKQHETS